MNPTIQCPNCGYEMPQASTNGGAARASDSTPQSAKVIPLHKNSSAASSASKMPPPNTRKQGLPRGVLWRGRPSHIANIRVYTWCVVVIAAKLLAYWYLIEPWFGHLPYVAIAFQGLGILPLSYAAWRAVELACRRFAIINNNNVQLEVTWGVFNRHAKRLELFLVNEIGLERPLLYRLLRRDLGTLILYFGAAGDLRNAEVLPAMRQSSKLADQFYQLVAEIRKMRTFTHPYPR